MTSRGRRGLAVAVVLAAIGLALVGAATTARWITAVPVDPEIPGSARVSFKGGSLVPAAVPLALVGVAGLAAAAAAGRMAGGVLRVLASLLVVLAGLGLAWVAFRVAADPEQGFRSLEAARQATATVGINASPSRWLAGAGGIAIAASGVVALLAGHSWPGLAARYERDPRAAPRSAAPATTWDALDRGDDPTR